MKQRLDQAMQARGLVATRSQAESWIKLGKVEVNGQVVTKPGALVRDDSNIALKTDERYVSRAGLKLASVAKGFQLDFRNKVMLDVGSSTGGFTDYALQHGVHKVYAIELGKDQLHASLRSNSKIELYEQTDIRDVQLSMAGPAGPSFPHRARQGSARQAPKDRHPLVPDHTAVLLDQVPDMVVVDVSFVSLRDILPHVAELSGANTDIIAMVKPQFEAAVSNLKHKGVIKNDRVRRDILKDFETWAKNYFVVLDKADSDIAGAHGNLERFYKLRKIVRS